MTRTGRLDAGGAAAGAPVPPPPSPTPPAARTRLWILAVLAVLVLGAAAATATRRDAEDDAAEREALLADQTGNLAVSTMHQLLAAVGGASGLADASGVVDRAAFDAFASGVVAASPLQTLAYAPVVTHAERPAVEAAIGHPLRDTPDGPPAPTRATYLPVIWVTPQIGATGSLVGFDLAADPARGPAAARARDLGRAVITGTVPSQPSGRPAVFLVQPVYARGLAPEATVDERRQALVGFVATGFVGDGLLESLEDQLTGSVGIRVEDVTRDADRDPGDADDPGVLAATDDAVAGGSSVEREVASRRWRITVQDRNPVTTAAPWWIAAGTVALAGALAVLALRARRHQRDASRHVRLVEALAQLGRSLTAADSVDRVKDIVAAEVPGAVDARTAVLVPAGDPRDAGPQDEGAGAAATTTWPVTDESGATVARLDVTWEPTGSGPDELALASLATVGELCSQTLGRARLADALRRDAVTSRLLAALAEAAATAGTADQVARTLVARAVEVADARTAHIGLLGEDGRSLTVTHHSGLQPAIAARHAVEPVESQAPLATAFRKRRPVLLADLDDVDRRFPEVAEDVRAAGLASLACLPLVDEDGTAFGAVCVTWSAPQRFDRGRLDTLGAIADLCASSLARARATDLSHARAARLASLAGQLSAARGFDDVGSAIIDHAADAIGADFAIVGVIERDQLRMLAPSGPQLDVLGHYTDLDLDGDFPALIALRRRELVTFSALSAVPEADVAGDLELMGLHAGACAPLIGTADEPLGVLAVLWSHAPDFDDDLRARIRTVADLCCQSAERAQLFDAEHRVRRDLQARVLPRIPRVAPFDVAARYRPAVRSVGMGGDWYDGIELGPGRLCLVLGDVVGHGVEAVAEMVQIRTVVHTLAAGGMPLPQVLARTSAEMQRDVQGYATLLMMVVDAERDTVEFVSAGHPPPVLRRADGRVTVLAGGRHSLLGIDVVARPAGVVPFEPGATLLGFTDGLVETRGEAIDASIGRLARTVEAAGDLPAGDLADRVLGERPGETNDDDVALVVVRRPPHGEGADP
ncbi:MAG TPA: SpoIIE family protein phosphatase [Acidimicrobiales bacterium]|nr:SpoIIE family protein phosphatase [Acidimicrobiales bacterium]